MRQLSSRFFELVRGGYIADTMHRIDPNTLASRAGQLDDFVLPERHRRKRARLELVRRKAG